ncbi:uncharacterized protein LOC134239294 [Saccostrea cucullata]|uniref:uncharacterized protein LOC134239294 n=1 Tax=Saccostrea cuccullata TaxID=36930 RepID=UPI002ED24ACA
MDQVPDTAQHFIECDTESCGNFSEFYCNTCHQRICDQCIQRHHEQKKNKRHDIVPYQERKRKIPSEKCRIHPTQEIDVYCYDCQDPVCSFCFVRHHSGHGLSDLETIYNDILQKCQNEITDIWKREIPHAKDNVELIEKKGEKVKKEIAKFRVSMKNRADELKEVVDNILNDKNKKLDEIENYVQTEIKEQQKETEDYIKYLEKMITDYESRMSSITHTELMKFHVEISLATFKMPYKSEPNLPTFTLGSLNKEEVAKQFGEIELDSPERITLSSVTKVSEKTIQEQGLILSHLSFLPPNKFWVSDRWGILFQFDMEGNILQEIPTGMSYIQGIHTVTTEGYLLYTDNSKNTVYRVTSDKSINKFIQTGSWEPGAIYFSPVNGHILLGMKRNRENKITRYNRDGRKLNDIQWDEEGQNIYQGIDYITENINGDICTSDLKACQVVMVTASGDYRFSYSGHHSQSGFHPYGVCTDVLGHMLVCNGYYSLKENCFSIHLLDINGQFLTLLLTPEQCPSSPCALCIDDKHNLWVGGLKSSTVFLYKYLQNSKI